MVNRRQLLKISALGTSSFAAPLAYSASNITMAYNTANAIGSTSPKDLSDNAWNLDHLLNGADAFYLDRKGVPRKSWKGMEGEHNADQIRRESEFDSDQSDRSKEYTGDKLERDTEFAVDQNNRKAQFNTFMDASGYEPPIPYVPGILLDRTTKTVTYLGNEYRAHSSFIPLTTSNWATDESNLKLVGDYSLRQNLASPALGGRIVASTNLDGTNGTVQDGLNALKVDRKTVTSTGAKGDGVTNSTAALIASFAEAGRINIPSGAFKFSSIMDVKSNSEVVFAADAYMSPVADSTPCLRLGGLPPLTWYTVAANVLKGSVTFSLSADYGWVVGDFVEFRSNQLIAGTNQQKDRISQIARIVYKSGNNYAIDRVFYYDFLLSESTTVGKPTMVQNVTLHQPRVNTPEYTTKTSFGIYIAYAANVTLIAPQVFGSKDRQTGDGSEGISAIRVSQCLDLTIVDPMLGHIAWYGIAFSGFNDNVRIEGGRGFDCRHVVSVVWGASIGATFGETWNLCVSKMHGTDTTQACFDTHDTGQNVIYSDCVGERSRTDAGFQIRNAGTRLVRPTARYNNFDGIVARNYGLYGGLDIEAPTLEFNGRRGATLGIANVVGGRIENNMALDGACLNIYGGSVQGTRMFAKAGAAAQLISVSRLVDMPTGSLSQSLRIENAIARPVNTGDCFTFYSSDRVADEIQIANCDLVGFGINTVRSGKIFSAIETAQISNSRIFPVDAVMSGSGSLVVGAESAQIPTTAMLVRNDPHYQSRVELRRLNNASAGPNVNGQLYVTRILSGVGFYVRSTNANDDGTFSWRVVS